MIPITIGLTVSGDLGLPKFDIDMRRSGCMVPGGAEMVFHVAGTLRSARIEVPLELGENGFVALAHDVRQHVEATPVVFVTAPSARFASLDKMVSRIGMRSPPSILRRFVPTYFVAAFEGLRRIRSLKNRVSHHARTEQATFKAGCHSCSSVF